MMKKNLFKIFTVIVFATIASYNVYNSQKTDVMSDLALANVEALAQTETSIHRCVSGGIYCYLYLNGNLVFESRQHHITY